MLNVANSHVYHYNELGKTAIRRDLSEDRFNACGQVILQRVGAKSVRPIAHREGDTFNEALFLVSNA